jgi:hypothetical protein
MAATGKTIHSEAREVVNHVISCVNKKQSRKVILPICGADKRTPEYCVVLVGTIAGIRKESKKKREGSLLHKPEKKAQKPERSVIIDESDMCVVRIKENFSNL